MWREVIEPCSAMWGIFAAGLQLRTSKGFNVKFLGSEDAAPEFTCKFWDEVSWVLNISSIDGLPGVNGNGVYFVRVGCV